LFLEYRNLFGRGERARAELEATELRQSASIDLTRPLPGFDALVFGNFTFLNETTDAFDARSVLAAGGFRKSFLDERLELAAGLAVETSSVESRLSTGVVNSERLYLVSTPLSATWSTEEDPLALTEGLRASLSVTPYLGTDNFARFEATARSRRQFGAEDRFTLAGRLRIAATAGTTLRALPVNKRVYSGGGSSVRGYDYQSVGPLDSNNVPLGGRSVVESAIEARARVAERLEVAAFVDAGAVYAERVPDFFGDYLVGAGGGVRYLSPIGPLRLDFALPLEKRASDRDFQFYVSLGQPF
jgi:translocation and assembly module TamA